MTIVPPELWVRLEKIGWHQNRRVPVDSRVPPDHPAHTTLAELGGLRITWEYEDFVVTEADFQFVPSDPGLARCWEQALDTRMIGIGEYHNAHGELLMSETGHVFGSSIIHPAFWLQGRSIGEALESLISNERGRPMLLENEVSAMHYGEIYTHDDAQVLNPSSPELR
jgi:hypothetical protein